jgi:prepilin-type N-terminal cleavage/methylation domain-containing protein
MRKRFKQRPFHGSGFTLVEMLVALGVSAVVGLVLFAVLQAASVLLAKNTGINLTHGNARLGNERLLSLVHSAVASPVLVDASLNPVSGDGPAAGITFLRLASSLTYTNVSMVGATATSMTLRRTAAMPAPQAGDVLIMVGTDNLSFAITNVIGLQASIATVTPISSTDYTLTFTNPIGTYCSPPATTGFILIATANLFLLNKPACVAAQKASVVENGITLIRSELRLANNATTYNASNRATYQVLAELVQTGGAQPLPFRYTTADRRWVDVDLRVESPTYNQRKLGTTNTFFDLKESIAFRSAVIVQTGK